MRFLTLLLVLLTGTCVRAQLRPNPPVFTYLADQLPEMLVTNGIPNGDYGPTRLALARQQVLWQPAYFGASWASPRLNHTGLGGFSPHYSWQPWRTKATAAFAGSADRYALRASTSPLAQSDRLSANVSFLQDRQFRDKNNDTRNDLPRRRSLFGSIFTSWGQYEPGGSLMVRYIDEEHQRQGRFRGQQRRLDLLQQQRWGGYDVKFFSKVNATAEYVDRNFGERLTDGRRLTGVLVAGAKSDYSNKSIRWEATLEALHREDRLDAPDIRLREREQFVAANGHFFWDVAPFRLTLNQQLRSSDLDGLHYRPHLQAAWFSIDDQVIITGLLNRGGGYRNPLLTQEHLGFTNRNYQLGDLPTEDFWRWGATGQAALWSRTLLIDVQALRFHYRKYIGVVYSPQNELWVGNLGEGQQSILATQVIFSPKFLGWRTATPTLQLNYRYHEQDFTSSAERLLPARHSWWLHLGVPIAFGPWDERWEISPTVSYLQQSPASGLSPEREMMGRNRLDASLRVQYKEYWIALRGDQLLRDEPLFAHGFDPSSGEDIPLGNAFSALTGRRFSVAVGFGFRD